MLNEFRSAIQSERKRIQRKANASNRDLRHQIHRDFRAALKQTKAIAPRFAGASCYETAANVHRFLRGNFLYKIDSPRVQRIKLPSAFARDLYADCKTFSLLACALLRNAGCPAMFKYASYNNSTTPSHIYVSIPWGNTEIIVDGTSPDFNYEKPPVHSFTIDPMRVETIANEAIVSEILADETLTSEATIAFVSKLQKMNKHQRRQFINSFNPGNRAKLIRSVKSYVKMRKLKGTGVSDESVVLGIYDDTNPFVGATHDSPLADEVLAGKKAKKRRADRKEKKAAKAKPGSNKAKRLATKAKILTAKANGDKVGLKAARKERNERIKGNVKKVGKVLAKINPVLGLGRGAFLGLVRLNMRGMATNMAAINDKAELKKKWEALGGKWGRLTDAIAKGKSKKALLGKKKISDEVLADGIYGEPITSGAAVASAAPVIAAIIPIVMKLLKKEGKQPTEDLNGDGLINEADAQKSRFGEIAEKVQDFIESRPVLNDAFEAGKEAVADRMEELGIKAGSSGESDAEKEENDPEVTGTPLWKILGVGAAVVGVGYYATQKKAA